MVKPVQAGPQNGGGIDAMNATERAKVKALGKIILPKFGHSVPLIRNLQWQLIHDQKHPLTNRQKYLLDLACWRYRNLLGGLVDFELPTEEPMRSDYFPDPGRKVQERLW